MAKMKTVWGVSGVCVKKSESFRQVIQICTNSQVVLSKGPGFANAVSKMLRQRLGFTNQASSCWRGNCGEFPCSCLYQTQPVVHG